MSDLIDRQALLRQIDIDSDDEPGYYGDTWKFIDTIKRMPSALGTNLASLGTDCISRQAAIDRLTEYGNGRAVFISVGEAIIRIEQLPPAQPERIKGHWVDDCTYMGIQCSICGKSLQDYIHATEYAELMEVPKFCPNCGADMRGEQDE